jgi:hypothetical protein
MRIDPGGALLPGQDATAISRDAPHDLECGCIIASPVQLVRAASAYEALILGCIDPRMQAPVRDYAVKQGLDGKYRCAMLSRRSSPCWTATRWPTWSRRNRPYRGYC